MSYRITQGVRPFGLCAALALSLTACAPGDQMAAEDGGTGVVNTALDAPDTRIEAAMELRPDVFSVRDMAMWDGRPSLGGLWVAHPDVTSAERVEITNLSNNIVTSGALFRRERSLPGPAFQLSAEAAIALNAPAGVPVQLSVVAVREGMVEIMTETPEATDTPDAEDTITPVAEAEVAESVPVADPAPAAPPRQSEPEPDPEVETPQAGPAQAPATPVTLADTAPDQPFMQVGMFGVAENAATLVSRLEAAGLPASSRSAGTLTRVVVGPASSARQLANFREQLRRLGFSDSIAISLQ